MNLQNQGPVFVPVQFQAEVEKLSKAALMDMVWDYAERIASADWGYGEQTPGLNKSDLIMAEFRSHREIILCHRKQAKQPARFGPHKAAP